MNSNKRKAISRRRLLTLAGGTAIISQAFPKPSIASDIRVLNLVTPWPRSVKNGNSISVRRIAETIEGITDGKLRLKIFWLGEMVKARQEFGAVTDGRADAYFAPEIYWDRISSGYNFFGSLPFGMTALETETWLYEMGGQDLWDELSAAHKIKPIAAGNTGAQMAGWFKNEIESISSFRGLRIRMPGIAGKIYKEIGAKPLFLPANKLVSEMKSNKVDAVEFVGPWPDMKLGLHKVAKNYYWPGFQSPGAVVALGINLDVWNSLSGSYQEIIRNTCMSEYRRMLSSYASSNGRAMSELRKRHKISLKQLPNEVLNEFGAVSGDVVADTVRGDKQLTKIYNSYIESRIRLLHWAKYSDEAFLVSRRLPFPYSPKNLTTAPPKIPSIPKLKKPAATLSRI